jgi:hypothetical protein
VFVAKYLYLLFIFFLRPRVRSSVRALLGSNNWYQEQGSSGSPCLCRRCDGVRWQQWRRGRRAVCRPVRGRWWEPALWQRIMCWSCRACCARRRMSPEREDVRRPAVCQPVHGSQCGGSGSCVGLAGCLCSTGVCHQRRRP